MNTQPQKKKQMQDKPKVLSIHKLKMKLVKISHLLNKNWYFLILFFLSFKVN